MGKNLPPRQVQAGPYRPTLARTGDDINGSFRMNNLIVRGRVGERMYWRAYSGEGDLGEDLDMVPLTGTLTLTAGETVVLGVGTLFNSECHLGQFILVINPGIASWLLVVRRVVSDTEMVVWKAPDTSISGLTGWRMPVLWAINDQRGTALRGNVIKLDKGSYVGVGDGTFRLDGATLPGTSLTLTRHPKIALLDPVTGTYTVFPLGMDTPAAPGVASTAGGTKGMQAGQYSICITPARKQTAGYNNPSVKATVTISANDKIRITFPAMDTAHGQNAWIVWVTTFTGSQSAAPTFAEGPFWRLQLIDDTQVSSAGGTFDVEYLDTEVQFVGAEFLTFDNDEPTDAEFVELLNAILVYVSCQGQGYATHSAATSPGPFIVPTKPNNIEAAPLEFAFSSSPPETIIGAVSAEGRIYLLTTNHLQIAQATPSDAVPILIRPFWRDGFSNPYQLVFVNGNLYGYPFAGPSRSVGDGDNIEAERNWAADVYEVIQHWNPGQVLVGYDPEHDMVCFIHAADALNDKGFWTSRILGFGIPQGFWIFDRRITSDTQDCIVSGVATIADRMELLIGGRGKENDTGRILTEDRDFIMTEDDNFLVVEAA